MNLLHWHSNPYIYWIDQCEQFYANKTVIDWIRSQHYDVAVVDLIQEGGPTGLDPNLSCELECVQVLKCNKKNNLKFIWRVGP